jgi:hypothetical protein
MAGFSLSPATTKPKLTEIRKKCREYLLLWFDNQSIWPEFRIGTMIDKK